MTPTETGALTLTTPSDTEVVVTRSFDAPRELVWKAYTEPEHITQWMLGPPGWTMPVCELENKFTQAQKMELVGQLAGGIAHDFNNVLGAIMMASDFLVNAHKPTDPSFQDIIQIRQNANRAAAMVRHLLAFSRKQTLRPQVIDLGDVVYDLTMLLRRLIGERITLNVVPQRDLWPVKADLAQFEQVLVNLVVNARDAMAEGGKLTLRTANVGPDATAKFQYKGMPIGEYVMVEVQDTGTGIPPEIIDKIFDPFFTTKDVGKGTGLGLSTVYGIVKQTGGFIYVEFAEDRARARRSASSFRATSRPPTTCSRRNCPRPPHRRSPARSPPPKTR